MALTKRKSYAHSREMQQGSRQGYSDGMCSDLFVTAVLQMKSEIKVILISSCVLLFSIISFLEYVTSGKLELFGMLMIDLGHKKNFLNNYFVKISWFWTLVAVVPLSLSSGYVLYRLSKRGLLIAALRMCLGTFVWWSVTNLFLRIDGQMGSCSNTDLTARYECFSKGHSWYGFDISGHIFLLTYSILLITEECQVLEAVCSIKDNGECISQLAEDSSKHMIVKDVLSLTKLVAKYSKVLCVIFVLNAFLMLCATSLFFHTILEKVLGLLMAVLCWYLTYRWVYPMLSWQPPTELELVQSQSENSEEH